MPLHLSAGRPRCALLVTALAGLLALAPASVHADTPSPAPTPTPGTSPAPSTSPTPTLPVPATSPSSVAPSRAAEPGADASATPALTLRVGSSGSPVAGRFYQDVGRYAFSGSGTGLAADSPVSVYSRLVTRTTWNKVADATVTSEAFHATKPVTSLGTFLFVATTGGVPGSGDEISSAPVQVQVEDSTIALDRPAATVDSLKNPTLTGSVIPARAGLSVHADVRVGSTYRLHRLVTTDAAGRFRATFEHGKGRLASYSVRAT